MVIETSSSYKALLQKIAGKSLPAVFIRDDNRNHPADIEQSERLLDSSASAQV